MSKYKDGSDFYSHGQNTPELRQKLRDEYVKFLASRIIASGDGSHGLTKRTDPMVAYIEAVGTFSDRATAFVKDWTEKHRDSGALLDTQLARKFVKAETKGSDWLGGASRVAKMENGQVTPRQQTCTGLNSEAAVYGAIFLDFANQTSMRRAVKAFHESKALNFSQYAAWVKTKWPGSRTDEMMDDITTRWDLRFR
jgi:hypothetical protein